MIPGYVTVAEAAELLGVTGGRIRQLVLGGQISAQKVGTTLIIPIKEVDKRKQALKKLKRNGSK